MKDKQSKYAHAKGMWTVVGYKANIMRVVILGIGNEMKADDGIGLLAAKAFYDRIRKRHTTFLVTTNVPENYTSKIEDFRPEMVMIFDAADFGGKAGEVRLIEKEQITEFSLSTHNASLGIFFEALGTTGAKMKIFLIGVQVKTTEFDGKISREVMACMPDAVSLGMKLL